MPRLSRLCRVWIFAICLGVPASQRAIADAIQYRVTDLGTTSVSASSFANSAALAISDSGVVSIPPAVPFYNGPIPSGASQGPFGTSQFGPHATAVGGQYTVGYLDYGDSIHVAFISDGKTATSLGLGPEIGGPDPSYTSVPYAVNRSGTVVGAFGSGFPIPFTWTSAGGFVPLLAPGYIVGAALGINDTGQIVGWNTISSDGQPGRAFLYQNRLEFTGPEHVDLHPQLT